MAPSLDGEPSSLTVLKFPKKSPVIGHHSIDTYSNDHGETRTTREFNTQQNSTTSRYSRTSSRQYFSNDQKVSILRDTIISTRQSYCTHFDSWDEGCLDDSTIEGFLEYIRHERLKQIPHPGSTLDRVLKWAEYFAIQVSNYSREVAPYIHESDVVAKLIWEGSKALLQLGPENDKGLEPTFHAFYKLGLSLSIFVRHSDFIHDESYVRHEIGAAFNDLLNLVSSVSIHYRKIVQGISRGPVMLDFNQTFGVKQKSFYQRTTRIIDSMWKSRLGDYESLDVRTIREWLIPAEDSLKTVLRNRKEMLEFREELTCEWFHKTLENFSRGEDRILTVTGPVGSGKTYLSSWIIETLQRQLGKKTHEVLYYSKNNDIPSQSTSLAIAQSLSLQLLEINVGDKALFEKLIVAYELSHKSADADVEEALWKAIHVGLHSFDSESHSLMIVLDGLDELDSGSGTVTQRVHKLTSQHKNVRAILLSRSSSSTKSEGSRHLSITPDMTHNDLGLVVHRAFAGCAHYSQLEEHSRETVMEKLVHHAHGSFLFAILMAELMKRETTHKKFMQTLNSLPKNLDETLHNLVGLLDLSRPDFKHLIAWMLVAERPLSVDEIRCLLSVDLDQKAILERKVTFTEDLESAGSLFNMKGGYVAFRHGYIRSYLLGLPADRKRFMHPKEAQKDLTMRLLAYCKFVPGRVGELSFEQMSWRSISDRLRTHHLMEYALRNWTLHFQCSELWKDSGHFEFLPEIKAIFPGSAEFALMEWTCWELQHFKSKAISMHDLALNIRIKVFSEKHESVLQNLIVCGNLYSSLSKMIVAATYFYRASIVGRAIHQRHRTITMDCAARFLSCTENIEITTRTEIVTKREQILIYIIDTYKESHEESSDGAISCYKLLSQLYVDIKEEDNAKTILDELHKILINRHGHGSEEATSVARELVIVLNKQKKIIIPDHVDILSIRTLEVWDMRRIESTLKLALSYESSKELFLAEELYITLWTQLTQHCRQSHHIHGVEIYIKTIDVALEYIRFLRRCHKHEEAASILVVLWEEYEEYEFDSEIIFLRFKIIGELMRAVSLLSFAISVFRKCVSWFSFHGKHEQVTSFNILITETVKEITIKKTITKRTEVIIRETFESTISRTTVTSESISIFQGIISLHMELKNWTQSITVIERSLNLVWQMIVSGSGTCALPKSFDVEARAMAINLAICHYHLGHFHEAGEIYVRIYHACKVSCHIDDERLTKSYIALIRFYEEHRRWEQIIEIYKELLVEYRQHLGVKHDLTIKTLYVLGRLCSEHGFGHGHEYYEEIVVIHNGSSHVCHAGAEDAMIFLYTYYHERGHWEQLKGVCHILWTTWTLHHSERKFKAEFVEVLYRRYLYVLQHHFHCEYEVLRKLTIEYRETCIKVFTAFSAITIKAMIALAEICMRNSKHVHEAVTIYEEVITKTTNTTEIVISKEIITTTKERLSEAYITVCSHDSVSSTTIEKAVKFLFVRFDYAKKHFGFAHSETLVILRELVQLHWKLKTKESHATMIKIIQESIIEILLGEKHSQQLHEAAIAIGAIYVTCELRNDGLELLAEIRRQSITKSAATKKYGFKVDHVGKSSYIFVVTLERILRGVSTITYSEIMTELLTETTLYEHYNVCLKSEKDLTATFIQVSRLRAFLLVKHRHEEVKHIEKHTFELFTKKFEATFKTQNRTTVMIIYTGILSQLAIETGFETDLGSAACISSTAIVLSAMSEGRFQDAYDITACAFHFMDSHGAFKHRSNIAFGVKLSNYMANRRIESKSGKAIPQELHSKMLELSQSIIKIVFKACKDHNISFKQLPLPALNEFVGLLGAQKNYTELESLLQNLFKTRDIQRDWTPTTTLSLSLRLVQAHHLASHPARALRLCEDICYNLRRVWGSLAPASLRMQEELSELYTAAGHTREAMGIHEDILRLIIEGDDGDDRPANAVTAEVARKHIEFLKRAHLRLGGWDKEERTYKKLVEGVRAMFKGAKELADLQGMEKWSLQEKDDGMGTFIVPEEWGFASLEDLEVNEKPKIDTKDGEKRENHPKTKPGLGMKRASSTWSLGNVHRKLFGEDEEGVGHRGNGRAHG